MPQTNSITPRLKTTIGTAWITYSMQLVAEVNLIPKYDVQLYYKDSILGFRVVKRYPHVEKFQRRYFY